MLSPLTRRQKEILDYVNMMIGLNGYAPSLQEVRDNFKLKAISTVHEHLENLKNKGYIKKVMNQARGVTITSVEELEKFKIVPLNAKSTGSKIIATSAKKRDILIDKRLFSDPKSGSYAVEATDDSLKSAGIKNRDILIIEEANQLSTGSLAVLKVGKSRIIDKSRNSLGETIVGRVICSIRRF